MNEPSKQIDILQKKMSSIESIQNLFSIYEDDEYMIEKTHNYICNQLPNILDNIKQTHKQRILRMEELTIDYDEFVHSFLNKNQYFYVASTENFFYYDGTHYHLFNEDDILYQVLSTISRDRTLMSWKHKTKIHIMKRIKENNLLKSIPESTTIQSVISLLHPLFFTSKTEAKYFLTVLGDNILKKTDENILFIDHKAKPFIRELNNICQFRIGVSLCHNIKHKYHDHSYSNCRLLRINDSIKHENLWISLVMQFALDIICVACHYSIRYGSSDDFVLKYSNDSELTKNVMFLKDITPSELTESFITQYLEFGRTGSFTGEMEPRTEETNASRIISWKNMQYLWKHFLDANQLPSVIFQNNLKSFLVEKLPDYYREDSDAFFGVFSRFLPSIQLFLQFWKDTIVKDETESGFEIEELSSLYRQWSINNISINKITNALLSDKQILDLIIYFFPTIDISRDKYLSNVRCILWDKQLDIQVAMNQMQQDLSLRDSSGNLTSVTNYDAYLYYCKYYSTMNENNPKQTPKLLVSKSYFESGEPTVPR